MGMARRTHGIYLAFRYSHSQRELMSKMSALLPLKQQERMAEVLYRPNDSTIPVATKEEHLIQQYRKRQIHERLGNPNPLKPSHR